MVIRMIGAKSIVCQTYQQYYQVAIKVVWPDSKVYGFGTKFKKVAYSCLGFLNRGSSIKKSNSLPEHSALYVLEMGSQKVKFVIDPHDHYSLDASQYLEECDYYFKSNYWRDMDYPKKVLPIVNGNGMLSPNRLKRLISLRNQSKAYDLVFVSRVWGGIEHNLRCFQYLKQLKINMKLVAVFPRDVRGSDDVYRKEKKHARELLESIGVTCVDQQIPLYKLWQMLSSARIVFLRAGKHLCIPWRMLDLLAMGSVIVTDSHPYPTWPVPLIEGVHYATAGIKRPIDTGPARIEEYDLIGEQIMKLIVDSDKQEILSKSSANYFDKYASPEGVGQYLKKCISG